MVLFQVLQTDLKMKFTSSSNDVFSRLFYETLMTTNIKLLLQIAYSYENLSQHINKITTICQCGSLSLQINQQNHYQFQLWKSLALVASH